jgi:hypothetical protein
VPAGTGDQILCFDVVGGNVADPSQVPAKPVKLRANPDLPSYLQKPLTPQGLKSLPNHTLFEFKIDDQGVWVINELPFDDVAYRVVARQRPRDQKNGELEGEVWTIKNFVPPDVPPDWSHPVHIHLEEFRILLRNGMVPLPGTEQKGRVTPQSRRGGPDLSSIPGLPWQISHSLPQRCP